MDEKWIHKISEFIFLIFNKNDMEYSHKKIRYFNSSKSYTSNRFLQFSRFVLSYVY